MQSLSQMASGIGHPAFMGDEWCLVTGHRPSDRLNY